VAVREVRADGSRKETKTQRKQNPFEFVRGPVGFAVGGSSLECNRGVWFIAVVLKLIGRPLHHTLREHAPWSRPAGEDGPKELWLSIRRYWPIAYRLKPNA